MVGQFIDCVHIKERAERRWGSPTRPADSVQSFIRLAIVRVQEDRKRTQNKPLPMVMLTKG